MLCYEVDAPERIFAESQLSYSDQWTVADIRGYVGMLDHVYKFTKESSAVDWSSVTRCDEQCNCYLEILIIAGDTRACNQMII